MLNTSKENAICKVLDELTDNKEIFTSVDVANEVKKAGTWIRNREVAAYLRKNFLYQYGDEYDNAPQTDIGGGIRATVYHPIGDDYSYYISTEGAMTPSEFNNLHGVDSASPSADNSTSDNDPIHNASASPVCHQTMAVADDDNDTTKAAKDKITDFFHRNLKFPKGN